ncbi:MAG: YSC84-related protein [Tepidisphaeraceae bacterium]|jgi:lipid-binding SYLF domain-containing protein
MRNLLIYLAALPAAALWFAGCSTVPSSQSDKDQLHSESVAAFNDFKAADPSLAAFLKGAWGYAIFPSIGKGAIGIGGAYGHGEVYEQGQRVGWTDMTQGTIGLQLGGQTYSELIVFQNKTAIDNFKSGDFALSAQASAVAAASGAAATAKFDNGVAVFVRSQSGLMYEASIGGQNFGYRPLSQ